MTWVCVVAGVPAVGKSTLCRKLVQLLEAIHVEGDLVVGTCNHETETYKQRRHKLLLHVRQLAQTGNVIVDECMWRKSMRRPLERMCGEMGCGFGVLWLCVDAVEVAIGRDAGREDGSVGEETIKKIHANSELPKDCLLVDSSHDIDIDAILSYIHGLKVPVMRVEPTVTIDVNNKKHCLNLELCRLAGELIRVDGLDPAVVCRAKRVLLAADTNSDIIDCTKLRESFIQEYRKIIIQ